MFYQHIYIYKPHIFRHVLSFSFNVLSTMCVAFFNLLLCLNIFFLFSRGNLFSWFRCETLIMAHYISCNIR